MNNFALVVFLLGATSSAAFAPLSPTAADFRSTTSQLFISQYFGDPASLETVNGVIEPSPQLLSEPEPEPCPEELEFEPEPEVVEDVKPYEAAPLAKVEPETTTTTTTTTTGSGNRYNGLAKLAPPSKRQNCVGVAAIRNQQKALNLHCHCEGDSTRELNKEFTSFL